MSKILIFSANYLPNVGGIERFTYYTAKKLTESGNEVTIVTNNLFDLPSCEENEGLKIYRFPCYAFLNGRYPVMKRNGEFKKIVKELNSQNFDFAIINARFYFHSVFGARFAKKHNIPVITIEHGTAHLSVQNKLFDFLGGIFEHMLTAALKCYCKDYYGVSKDCCEWSAHFGIKSKGVIYNAVDLEEINTHINNRTAFYRKDYGIGEDATVVLFTGRLVEDKGVFKLIDAVNNINDSEIYLFIAGDGPQRNEVEKSVSEKIKYLGKLDFPCVVSALCDSDIFCLPTVFAEGFPTSVLEAAAVGSYVITTKYGGSKELIISDEYGTIMDSNDALSIEKAIRYVINNREKAKISAQNCKNRLKENFTFDKTAKRITEIMNEIKN